jgi:hypothetical protein
MRRKAIAFFMGFIAFVIATQILPVALFIILSPFGISESSEVTKANVDATINIVSVVGAAVLARLAYRAIMGKNRSHKAFRLS